jgi:hypothetical protein
MDGWKRNAEGTIKLAKVSDRRLTNGWQNPGLHACHKMSTADSNKSRSINFAFKMCFSVLTWFVRKVRPRFIIGSVTTFALEMSDNLWLTLDCHDR